ncbi:MAG: hypothetical protein SVS85_02725 [Candidatus Nanohaloarchaea archaeon]|nr:hypothetical protein [Candidatus Nanohaloarchaea archaeon]
MQPEKHLRELEHIKRNNSLYAAVTDLIFFLTGYFFMGTVLHEAVHVGVLRIIGCSFSTGFGFSLLTGLHGAVQPLCAMSSLELAVFYGSGYLATLIAGTVLLFYSFSRNTRDRNTLSLGTGILISILATVTLKGDMVLTAESAGVKELAGTLTAITVVFILGLTLWTVEKHHQKGRNGAATSP